VNGLNKRAVFPPLGFLSRFDGFRGKLIGARVTKFGMSLCHLSTRLTDWLKSGGRSDDPSSMQDRMTILAKSNSVGNIIAQIGVIFPRLDVVGVYHPNCPALLACEIIFFVNGGSPLLVLITAAPLVVWFAGSVRSTFWRTISSIDMSGRKEFPAPLTGYNSGGVGNVIAGIRTVKSRMGVSQKFLSANPTFPHSASIAIKPEWLTRYKWIFTFFASKVVFFLLGKIKTFFTEVHTAPNPTPAFFTRCSTLWASLRAIADRIKFFTTSGTDYYSHALIVPHAERMNTAFPGLPIERIGN
jgi:hypothetical protein